MEIKSSLEVLPINDLLGRKFYVPSYQRGYRWTPVQVEELLDDIWEFHQREKIKEEFYCLQPIVVKPMGDEWELIDGQQRLTTIFLILQFLKPLLTILGKESYTIRYQTRKESETFLSNIQLTLEKDNIDYFHFCNAYKAVESWFGSKDGNAKINFLTTLLNDKMAGRNVKVIWYEVGDINAVDIFTRINIGKIPLNNAELVRALFLRRGNFKLNDNQQTYLKQLQIASEWDSIENTLQQDSFWYFIYESKPRDKDKYPTRIEYIFDLITDKKEDYEENHTFHKFNKRFDEVGDINTIWLEVKQYFQTFRDWYNSPTFYHLVGYLIATGSSIQTIKLKSQGLSKSEFNGYITNEIKKKVNYDITVLEYGDQRIRSLLLLFNIQTLVNNKNAYIRFPFHRYKTGDWDIEHIRSKKSDKPAGPNQRKWLQNVLTYFTGCEGLDGQPEAIAKLEIGPRILALEIYGLIALERFSDEDFTNLYYKVLEYFGEGSEPETIDSIANLALLDSTTNRSYKNAVFPVKRKTILDNESMGTFIPICTKNAFLKAYSIKVDNIMFWQEDDAADYIASIKKCLKTYLP